MPARNARERRKLVGRGIAAVVAWALVVTLSPVGAAWANNEAPAEQPPTTSEAPADQQTTAAEAEGHDAHGGVGPQADYPNDPHDSYDDCVEKSETFGHGLCGFLEQSDGTRDWDDLDSGPDNGVVRTNDLLTYTVSVWSKGGHTAGWFTLKLPKGAVLETIPGICGPGSTLTPPPGEPAVPLTSTSWQSLPQQTLVCQVGAQGDSVNKYPITAKVRPEVPKGTVLEAQAQIECSTGGNHFTKRLEAEVVSEPRYDISKNSFVPLPEDGSDANNGPINFDNSRLFPCSFDASITCTNVMYLLWVSTPKGGKGVSPATELSFIEDLSPESFYGDPDIRNHPNWDDSFRPRLTVSGMGRTMNGVLGRSFPGQREKGVRYSGTPELNPAAGADPGDGRYTLRFTDADLSAWTVPTTNDWGQPIPDTGGGVINLEMLVEIPREALFALGTANQNGSSTLRVTNKYTDFQVTDIAGQPNAPGADSPRNNTRVADLTAARGQGDRGFSKSFIGIPTVTQNSLDVNLSPHTPWQRPYVIGENELVGSRLTIARTRALEAAKPNMTALTCDYWDPAQFTIEPGNYGPLHSPSNGEAVWNMQRDQNAADLRKVQYGVHSFTPDPALPGGLGLGALMPSNCEDARVAWYDSLDQVPGGRSAVGAVRAQVMLTPNARGDAYAYIGIALRSTSAPREENTIMPNYAGYRFSFHTAAEEPSWTEALAMPSLGNGRQAINGDPSEYIANAHTGTYGDRVVSGSLYAFITKQVRNRAGAYVNTVESFAGGQTAGFRLTPILFSVAGSMLSDRVVVEDCIPAGFTLESSNHAYSLSRPSTATLACAAGETYVSWDLGARMVIGQSSLPPIDYEVSISTLIEPGVHRNTARVIAQGDPAAHNPPAFPRVTRTLDVNIDASQGVFLEKTTLPGSLVTSVNRPGQIANQPTSWEVRIGNLGFTGPGDVDIIDTLPTVLGSQGNDFRDTMRFAGVQLTEPGAGDPAGTRASFYYTTEASFEENPEHPSNWQNGAVTPIWKPIPAAGLAPETAAAVTGIRLLRSGAFQDREQIAFHLHMEGIGNRAGDTYRNTTRAVAHEGLPNLVMSSRADSAVLSSSIGQRVWWDLNRNGVRDVFRGEPEPAAAGVVVRLTGVDDLGNAVEVETRTGDDGEYAFSGLRPSDAAGYTVTFVKPAASEFTAKHAAGATPGTDSDADPATGASDPVVLGADEDILTIDAGLLANGSLVIAKSLEGAGVRPFAGGDTLEFEVSCLFEGETVREQVSLPVPAGATSVTSDPITGLPALAECTVTETGAGSADESAVPVTVQIPWDSTAGVSGTVTASLTNYYSAGTVALTKQLEGDGQAVEAVRDIAFEVLVTCQIDEAGERASLHSGVVKIKGGRVEILADAAGRPIHLPLGARCFAEETDSGGAVRIGIVHDSFENGVEVTSGTPEELQRLTISVVNTFACTEQLCPEPTNLIPGIPVTGAALGGIAGLGAALLLSGGVLLLLRRRREETSRLRR